MTVNEAEFERLLREKYESILSVEDYLKLRRKCGLKEVIEGETKNTPKEITSK